MTDTVPEPTRSGRLVVVGVVVTVVLAAAAVAVAAWRAPERLSAADAEPTAAPAADAVLVDGAWPEVAAFVRGQADLERPTVVKFFASWCEPCKVETPHVLAVAAANPDVAFIGVAHQDLAEPARAFVDRYGLDAMPTVLDPMGETARQVRVLGMPGVAFFDDDGILVGSHIGPVSEQGLQRWLDGLTGRAPLPEQ